MSLSVVMLFTWTFPWLDDLLSMDTAISDSIDFAVSFQFF